MLGGALMVQLQSFSLISHNRITEQNHNQKNTKLNSSESFLQDAILFAKNALSTIQ